MYQVIADKILVRCLDSKNYLNEEEYEKALYMTEVFLINIGKMSIILGAALVMKILPQTFAMLFAYNFVRQYAFGWHALSSINCTLISLVFFVLIPYLLKAFLVKISFVVSMCVLGTIFYLNYQYAPADTEKNPLVNKQERAEMRKSVLKRTTLLSIIILLPLFFSFKSFLLLGMATQSLMVTPLIYKLTKRSYRNYENYEEI